MTEDLAETAYREFLAMQLAISDDPEYPELDWFIPYICLDTWIRRAWADGNLRLPETARHDRCFSALRRTREQPLDPARLSSRPPYSQSVDHDAEHNPSWTRRTGRRRSSKEPITNAQEILFAILSQAGGQNGVGVTARASTSPVPGWVQWLTAGPGVDIVSALVAGGIGDVFLKEFRDSANPKQACYQAVCKTDTIPADFHGGGCIDRPAMRSRYRTWRANRCSAVSVVEDRAAG